MIPWETVLRSGAGGLCWVLGIAFLITGKPIAVIGGVIILALGCVIVFDRS